MGGEGVGGEGYWWVRGVVGEGCWGVRVLGMRNIGVRVLRGIGVRGVGG